jgi:FkbM family methyltransferase
MENSIMQSRIFNMGLLSQVRAYLHTLSHPRTLMRERRLLRSGIEPSLYKLYDLAWLRGIHFDLILDIGAARGGHTCLFRSLFPDAEIHAFEPLPQSLKILHEQISELPRISVHPIALSDRNAKTKLYWGGQNFNDSSSLLPMSSTHRRLFEGSGSDETVEIETRCLDDVIDSRHRNIFIKMDVQGAELAVIGGGERIFSEATVVITEISFLHLYQGDSLFEDVFTKMLSLGLRFNGMLSQFNDVTGKIIQGDAIFLRN